LFEIGKLCIEVGLHISSRIVREKNVNASRGHFPERVCQAKNGFPSGVAQS